MEFLSMRELRGSTASIRKMLVGDGKIVVTNNGKPEAIMIGVNGEDFEETLLDLRAIRAKRALRESRRLAAESGRDAMTLDEINAEIAAYRKERRERNAKYSFSLHQKLYNHILA